MPSTCMSAEAGAVRRIVDYVSVQLGPMPVTCWRLNVRDRLLLKNGSEKN
jgi:hypothetical protein